MTDCLETDAETSKPLDQTVENIQHRLAGRLRGFRACPRDQGVVLRGQAQTHYAKQLSQQAFMEATILPIVANEIEVDRAKRYAFSSR